MSKKPSGRFLLTWNEEKHPEVTAFFEEIKEGLYSHTLRNVIKSYMEDKVSDTLKDKNFPNHSVSSDREVNESEKRIIPKKEKNVQEPTKNDDWLSFNHDEI